MKKITLIALTIFLSFGAFAQNRDLGRPIDRPPLDERREKN
jgi:hypothetical protein